MDLREASTVVAVTIVMRVCKYLTPEPAWWMLV